MSARRQKTKGHPGIYWRIGADGKRQYEISYRDETGTRRWQRVEGDLQAAADALADVKAKLRGGVPVRPDHRTFQELYDEWAPIYLPRLRPSTRATYERSMRNYVLPTFGPRQVQRIDTHSVAQWITALQQGAYTPRAGGRKPAPLKAWTIRAAITPLRRVLTYAKREGLIPENPVTHLERDEMPVNDEGDKRVLTSAELRAIFGQGSERYRLPFQVLAFTGLRASELLALTWAEVDLRAGVINVQKQLGLNEDGELDRLDPKTPKGKRRVYLMASLLKALKAHKLASQWSQEGDYVFPMPDGTCGTYPGLEGAFKHTVRKANLGEPRPTLHSLRHGFGSMLAKQTGDVAHVSKRMGHANPSITARIYTHELESEETGRRSMKAMEDGYGDALNG